MVIDLLIHEEGLGQFDLFVVVWSRDKPSIISVGLLDTSAQAVLFWLVKFSQLLISSHPGNETSSEVVDNI